MRVLVCGGRYFADVNRMLRVLDRVDLEHGVTTLIHGAAPGADAMAGRWARNRNRWSAIKISIEVYPADWAQHGRRAGYLRNVQMLREGRPDLVVAFAGGSGTAMMVRLAGEAGVRVEEV